MLCTGGHEPCDGPDTARLFYPEPVTQNLRVLIVDDQPLMSGALKTLVDSAPGMSCLGIAANGAEAVEACDATTPDAVSYTHLTLPTILLV